MEKRQRGKATAAKTQGMTVQGLKGPGKPEDGMAKDDSHCCRSPTLACETALFLPGPNQMTLSTNSSTELGTCLRSSLPLVATDSYGALPRDRR